MYSNVILACVCVCTAQTVFAQNDTVGLSFDQQNSKDAWVWSMPNAVTVNFGEANASNGGFHNVLRTETWQWNQGVFDTIRSFIQIDIPSTINSDDIHSAYLNLSGYSNPGFQEAMGDMRLTIEPITEPWVESEVNWINQPAVDSTIAVYHHQTLPGNQNVSINVTELLEYSLLHDNRGWRLRLTDESGGYNVFSFASSEHESESLRPTLAIVLKEQVSTGFESTSQNPGVNCFPNPASSSLRITGLPDNANLIEVYSVSGELSWSALLENDSFKGLVDVSSLADGFYILKVTADEPFTLPFIINGAD